VTNLVEGGRLEGAQPTGRRSNTLQGNPRPSLRTGSQAHERMDPWAGRRRTGDVLEEGKPRRVAVPGMVQTPTPWTRTLAGSKALRRGRPSGGPSPRKVIEADPGVPRSLETRDGRDGRPGGLPTSRGHGIREDERLCGWRSTLEGEPQGRDQHETRLAGPGRRKALRACETPRGHVPGGWYPPGQVAARYREDAEGEQTAREEAIPGDNVRGGGVGAAELWRGAERHERSSRRIASSGRPGSAKTSKVSREAKTREGAKKPYGR